MIQLRGGRRRVSCDLRKKNIWLQLRPDFSLLSSSRRILSIKASERRRKKWKNNHLAHHKFFFVIRLHVRTQRRSEGLKKEECTMEYKHTCVCVCMREVDWILIVQENHSLSLVHPVISSGSDWMGKSNVHINFILCTSEKKTSSSVNDGSMDTEWRKCDGDAFLHSVCSRAFLFFCCYKQ